MQYQSWGSLPRHQQVALSPPHQPPIGGSILTLFSISLEGASGDRSGSSTCRPAWPGPWDAPKAWRGGISCVFPPNSRLPWLQSCRTKGQEQLAQHFLPEKGKKRRQLFFWFRLPAACLSVFSLVLGEPCPQSVDRDPFTEKILINKPQRDPVCPGEPAGSHGERGAVWRTLCSHENRVRSRRAERTEQIYGGHGSHPCACHAGKFAPSASEASLSCGGRARPAEFPSRVKELSDPLNFSLSIFILKKRRAITARPQKKARLWERS